MNPLPYKSSTFTHLSLLFRAPCALKIWQWSLCPCKRKTVQQCSIQSFLLGFQLSALSPASRFMRPCGAKTLRLASRCGVLLPERSCDPLLGMETWEAEDSRECGPGPSGGSVSLIGKCGAKWPWFKFESWWKPIESTWVSEKLRLGCRSSIGQVVTREVFGSEVLVVHKEPLDASRWYIISRDNYDNSIQKRTTGPPILWSLSKIYPYGHAHAFAELHIWEELEPALDVLSMLYLSNTWWDDPNPFSFQMDLKATQKNNPLLFSLRDLGEEPSTSRKHSWKDVEHSWIRDANNATVISRWFFHLLQSVVDS